MFAFVRPGPRFGVMGISAYAREVQHNAVCTLSLTKAAIRAGFNTDTQGWLGRILSDSNGCYKVPIAP